MKIKFLKKKNNIYEIDTMKSGAFDMASALNLSEWTEFKEECDYFEIIRQVKLKRASEFYQVLLEDVNVMFYKDDWEAVIQVWRDFDEYNEGENENGN